MMGSGGKAGLSILPGHRLTHNLHPRRRVHLIRFDYVLMNLLQRPRRLSPSTTKVPLAPSFTKVPLSPSTTKAPLAPSFTKITTFMKNILHSQIGSSGSLICLLIAVNNENERSGQVKLCLFVNYIFIFNILIREK